MSSPAAMYRVAPLAFCRKPEAEMIAAACVYADAMQSRRTARAFSSEPFPEQILDDAIRAAGSASSGAHQQPWTFVVVIDDDLKQQIRRAAEIEEKENWNGRMSEEWRAALEPLGVDWQKPHLTGTGWALVGERRVKHYYVDESVGVAVGMLLSALHLSGLATLTHAPSPMAFCASCMQRRPTNAPTR